MKRPSIAYHNVQESLGMGGPYLGNLELDGIHMKGIYQADGECMSSDATQVLFVRYMGPNPRLFGLFQRHQFRILLLDLPTRTFSQSNQAFPALAIESYDAGCIVYHQAFHTENPRYRRILVHEKGAFHLVEDV